MGIERNTARFLLQSVRASGPLGRALTLGRQSLFLNAGDHARLGREFGLDPAKAAAVRADPGADYAEPFLKAFCGATAVDSVDVSDYERATHVHDMNLPLPRALKGQYDTAIDAGSLEHIFNFPTAVKSMMEAVRPGGRVLIQTPANNYFGHGFYQFSPELFFRVFSAPQGFRTRRVVVFEHFFPCHFFEAPWFEVRDPDEARARVQLVGKRPLLMMVEAEKVEERPIFETPPQQSDYTRAWARGDATAGLVHRNLPLGRRLKERLLRLPLAWVGHLWLQHLANHRNKPSLSNRKFYTREDGG
jgi:SAM-dependent methyltransferase